jgi:Immunity protein 50
MVEGSAMSVLRKLPGGTELEDWFGYVPNFHDSEVESLDFRRDPEPSILRIHAWRASNEVDESGYYRRDRHATVSFILSGIAQMEINGWNHQNVLAGLEVAEDSEGYVLTLYTTFGVDGQIVAKRVSVTIEPRQPPL